MAKRKVPKRTMSSSICREQTLDKTKAGLVDMGAKPLRPRPPLVFVSLRVEYPVSVVGDFATGCLSQHAGEQQLAASGGERSLHRSMLRTRATKRRRT